MIQTASTMLPLPPGATGLPWIGETLEWVRDPLRFAQERHARYGPVWRTHLMGRHCVVLLGPEANRFILSTHTHLFSSRDGWGKPITSLIGGGLSLIDGEIHRRHRRMISPALHGVMLARYFDVILELARYHIAAWLQREQLRLFDDFKQLSFDIAARLILGMTVESERSELARSFHIFTTGLFAPPAWRLPWTRYGKAWRAGQELRIRLRQLIATQRDGDGDDMLGLLLASRDDQGRGFTDDELIDELLVLLWAGHDTVTSLLTYTIYELLRHPEIAAQAYAEQERVVGHGQLTLAHLKQMPLLERIVREAERLHPPAPGGFRGVREPFDYGGFRIPAGWTVMYSSVFTHHMPELWHAPEHFEPDRFAAPRKEGDKPFHLIGFGGGPRICIGYAFAQMQMRIVLSQLLRFCRLELVPDQDLRPVAVPTKMPRDGLLVRISGRPASR